MGDKSRTVSIGLFALAISIFVPCSSLADTFLVDSSVDSIDVNPGDAVCLDASGDCTLRAAIVESNALPGTDTVRLPAGTYQLTIPGNGEDASLQGDLDITEALTLESLVPGDALNTIIEQTTGGGVIQITTNQLVVISGVTITGAMGTGEGGGVTSVVLGTVQIQDTIIRDNQAGGGGGGGWRNFGNATVLRVAVHDNTSTGRGGGIYHLAGLNQSMTIIDSTISGNVGGSGGGGGINAHGDIFIRNTTISGNSTNSGQNASAGAGLYVAKVITATLNNVTVYGNTGTGPETRGGGIGVAQEIVNPVSAPGILFIGNSIIAGNMAGGVPSDCAGGDLNSNGNNLVQATTNCVLGGVGDIVGDPLLLPLAVDTGLTSTHVPTIGSPVVDAGNPSLPGSGGDACEATEQRGFDRPIDGDLDMIDVCDTGAVELYAVLIFGQAPASFEDGDFGDWDVFP